MRLPKHVARLAERVRLPAADARLLLRDSLAAVVANVAVVPAIVYEPLEAEARGRIARDSNDWPSVALALTLRAGIWTEDGDFLGCGAATWTTAVLGRTLDSHAF